MTTRRLWRFLKPSWAKLALLLLFAAIMLGGQIQAWAFSDLPPKPPLYDLLRPFPIWPLWMLSLVPLALLTWPLRELGMDIMGGPAWVFITANLAYFYLLSCLIVAAVGWVRSEWRSKKIRE